MKSINLLCGLMMLAGMSASGIVQADHRHHSHVGVGVFFGFPYYYPPFYYYPYPYYPPVVAVPVPTQPPVYIEQGSAEQEPATAENYYWYHCDKPDGYYPYIKECPGGWQKVVPTSPPPH